MKKFIFLFLVITWLVAIYSFSNMDSNKSNTKSKEAINKVVSGTIKVKDEIENKINNTSNITSKEEINKITNKLNLPLRKVVHSLEYLILFILILFFLKFKEKNIIIASIFCLIYAITDEIHQLFVLNRTGQVLDVLIDMSGIIIVLIIYYSYKFVKEKRKVL